MDAIGQWLKDTIAAGWPLMVDHPALFFAIGMIGFSLGWGVAWLYFRQQLNLRADRIEHYRAQLGERTPVERERRRTTRETLGELLNEGHALLERCGRGVEIPTEGEIGWWVGKVENFLSGLGASYVARFRSDAGLPPIDYPSMGIGSEQMRFYTIVWRRNARIAEFVGEFRDA
jgi:hypothetical protein